MSVHTCFSKIELKVFSKLTVEINSREIRIRTVTYLYVLHYTYAIWTTIFTSYNFFACFIFFCILLILKTADRFSSTNFEAHISTNQVTTNFFNLSYNFNFIPSSFFLLFLLLFFLLFHHPNHTHLPRHT